MMRVDPKAYLEHFREYGSHFFRIEEEDKVHFTQRDAECLSKWGLPENAIPFFFFDFYIQILRDVNLPDSKFILGTAFEPTARHYLYVSRRDEVMLCMDDGKQYFVNSSVCHLVSCLYQYSTWLEEQENAFILDEEHRVDEETMFDLYCRLRDSDRLALNGNGIWNKLVKTNVNFVVQPTLSGSSN
jgi:hypothetical protein